MLLYHLQRISLAIDRSRPLKLGAVGQSVPSVPFGSAPLSLSSSASRHSTDSVWPSCPPSRFSLPIYGQTTLTYPVFRIWWDATDLLHDTFSTHLILSHLSVAIILFVFQKQTPRNI